jgi:multiple sugar transport system permease protein
MPRPGGGPSRSTETVALYIYNEAFAYLRMGPAAAAGVLMILTAFIVAFATIRFIGHDKI